MKLALFFVAIAIISYFVGTINFAKIIAWNARRKDITKIGSKNPGTMNMLRSFGFGLAISTFLGEVAKAGLTCLICKLLFRFCGFPQYQEIAYFFSGFFVLMGYIFPVWSKFKGGKGVACFAGIFLFSQLWYVGIVWFLLCFAFLVVLDYGSVISFTYIGGLSTAYTIFIWLTSANIETAIFITAVIWFLYALMLIKHRGNIHRLITHTENKVGFKDKLEKFFKRKDKEVVVEGETTEETHAEEEIVIEEEK